MANNHFGEALGLIRQAEQVLHLVTGVLIDREMKSAANATSDFAMMLNEVADRLEDEASK